MTPNAAETLGVGLNGHGTGAFHTMQIRVTAVERGNTEVFDAESVIF